MAPFPRCPIVYKPWLPLTLYSVGMMAVSLDSRLVLAESKTVVEPVQSAIAPLPTFVRPTIADPDTDDETGADIDEIGIDVTVINIGDARSLMLGQGAARSSILGQTTGQGVTSGRVGAKGASPQPEGLTPEQVRSFLQPGKDFPPESGSSVGTWMSLPPFTQRIHPLPTGAEIPGPLGKPVAPAPLTLPIAAPLPNPDLAISGETEGVLPSLPAVSSPGILPAVTSRTAPSASVLLPQGGLVSPGPTTAPTTTVQASPPWFQRVTGSATNSSLRSWLATTPPDLWLAALAQSDLGLLAVDPDTDPLAPAAQPPEAAPVPRSWNPLNAQIEGVYVFVDDRSSARVRLLGSYVLSPNLMVGTTLELVTGNAFTANQEVTANINELYAVASLPQLPTLRLVVGQMDLTAYFDRNSFAKDVAIHFMHPVFQTNPALSAAGLQPRPGALLNWAISDQVDARAAVYASTRRLDAFALDSFAGEVAARFGNAIVRASYVSGRDGGADTGFGEIYQYPRAQGETGIRDSDWESGFGLNGEIFIPNWKLGLFGRYGWYENRSVGQGGDTYSMGMTLLDLLMPRDRLGLAYGRSLSNNHLRQQQGHPTPDVWEFFYDFPLSRQLRVGLSFQERNNFRETVIGLRVRSLLDLNARID